MTAPRKRLAIVGAGILGLAHALAAVKQGYQVSVFERHSQACGASVRNFGLGLALGQPQGELLDLARHSLKMWHDILPQLGCWYKSSGSLVVARNMQELAILEIFQEQLGKEYATSLRSARDVSESGIAALGGLVSPHEIGFASRQVIPALAHWLAERHGVTFHYGTQVNAIDLPQLQTSKGKFSADQVLICSGHDFQTLFPELYPTLGIRICSLQMLKLAIPGLVLKPTVMTGLSCLHYPSFAQTSALRVAVETLRNQVADEQAALIEHGIHLILQQLGTPGELIVGDSHHYGTEPDIFQSAGIEQLLLELTSGLLKLPVQKIEHWQGVYASAEQAFQILQAAPGVRAIHVTAGIGMSIGLALAEQVLTE